MDQPERIVDRGYGSRIALPIWADIMVASRDLRYPTMAMPEAVDVTTIELCRRSGQLASPECRAGHSAYEEHVPFAMIPRHNCDHMAGGGVIPNRGRIDPAGDAEKSDGIFGRLKGIFSES
jgi:penicillin-binding protein 1A